MGTLIPIVYLAGVVLSIWPTVQAVNRGSDELEIEDWLIAGIVGVGVAMLWPMVLAVIVAFYLSRWFWRAVLGDRPSTSDRDPEGSRHA